ncbi:tRNA pseudouridine synthase B [Bacillus sp. FJAT-27916]|uniref:tRNA pseudouridine(55) synthase TruB n=1 Tax=Bacillaceae TaxID=186817 RepID=UPI000670CF73|nr:tRNA pseudouridine(55) synthase TruB [Bacillus sp. FJAT-27916]KMY44968.1 tRNA pseudouridine synthase B [Bacillus sp. FJAT-27916]
MSELNGILILNKPAGATSHDCIIKVRKILKMKKVGHTGTLDPDVTGVLPICLGKATRVAEYITDAGKEYIGEVTLGWSTTTEDASGDIVSEKKVDRVIKREEILAIFDSLTGEITQTPPIYSAVKVNGKRLYEYALKGQEVEIPSRKVRIYEIELLDDRDVFEGDSISFKFRVACGKGTYIRTLSCMIGEQLGFPAHMSKLVRSRSARFTLEDAISLERLSELAENGEVQSVLRPIEEGIVDLPRLQVSPDIASRVQNGAVLSERDLLAGEIQSPFAVLNEQEKLLAVYQHHPEKKGLCKPVKVIPNV